MKEALMSVVSALVRCRKYALSILTTYFAACVVGIFMVHAGNGFALSMRDKIVRAAMTTDKAAINDRLGNNFAAAVDDCAGNIIYAAVPQTIIGLGIVFPYCTVAYQGWIGGIVSVNGSHESRFRNVESSAYYFIVVLLQFIPFSLSIGAGVKCGVDAYGCNRTVSWRIWKYRIPKESLMDLARVYAAAIPLFFIASCFEFLSSWNI